MKTSLLVIAMALSLASGAQDSVWVHATVSIVPRMLSDKVNVSIDYGQNTSFFNDKRLKDEEGRIKKFNSATDVFNFLGKAGWQMITATPLMANNGQVSWVALFRRKEAEENVIISDR